MEKSIREQYFDNGVAGYYKNIQNYHNPHIKQITELLTNNLDKIKRGNILDMCCGSGEVTKILLDNQINKIKGSDKYTGALYIKNTSKDFMDLSFKDILSGKLCENFSTIICSFALHLVNDRDLRMIIVELFRHTGRLIIIAPHKRPFIERYGVNLRYTAHSFTPRGKKVYMRVYETKTL